MTQFQLFQCIPAYKPGPTSRLIKSLFKYNCKILLDLEDSIQNVLNPKLNSLLKAQARKDFIAILAFIPERKISLRINRVGSEEFENDLILLDQTKNRIESVFLPKVESMEDILIFQSCTSNKFKLNLILETKKGIENIDQILSPTYKVLIDKVFFGNYDYHLDSNIFPVHEQSSDWYWNTIKQIISSIEQYGYGFGNSPYALISDTTTLQQSMLKLNKICSNPYALMSLHLQQTKVLFRTNTTQNLDIKSSEFEGIEDLKTSFIKNLQKGRSFSFDNQRIITPQEYFLATAKHKCQD
ncbi:MAG: hypothetical protein COA58_10170 [Bacteroidetes bacterium]|nr:MAG: hypothetical protein COA58_10170 [Bacteroidota bacterium]